MGSALKAVQNVLAQAGEPLHYTEIARRALDTGLWQTDGKTPDATINAQLAVHIKKHGKNAKFRRVGSGVFELNRPDSSTPADTSPSTTKRTLSAPRTTGVVSFTDAAEQVLTRLSSGQPMYYRDVTAKALELGLIQTSGRTPQATMYASVLEEIQRYRKRGEQPRFVTPGKGMIGLAKSLPAGIPSQIEQHNRKVRARMALPESASGCGVLI